MRTRPQPALLALTLAVLVLLAVGIALALRGGRTNARVAAGGQASAFDGAALPAPAPAPDFTLADQRGRSVSLSAYRGRVVLLSFLSSSCGAGCVLLAQQVRGALDELARPVPVIFVSLDPAADRASAVRRFLGQVSLSGRVEYLAGPARRLPRVWRAYHVQGAASGARALERSTWVMLVDARGRERVLFGLEQLTPEALAHDIRELGAG